LADAVVQEARERRAEMAYDIAPIVGVWGFQVPFNATKAQNVREMGTKGTRRGAPRNIPHHNRGEERNEQNDSP